MVERRRYRGPVGLGLWLMKTQRSIRRTDQEIRVRDLLIRLGLEFEEQYPIMLGREDGRPGKRLEDGVSWAVVDFFVRGERGDVVIECCRFGLGKSYKLMMMRIRQRAQYLNVRFYEIKMQYDVECIAFLEAPIEDLAGYVRPRIKAGEVIDKIEDLERWLRGRFILDKRKDESVRR